MDQGPNNTCARVAQSVERGTFNPKVQGSSPCPGDLFYFYFRNRLK